MDSPIGILDSGIGGVTVLKEILKLLPNEKYIYYSDSKNNPYGDKSKEEVYSLVLKIVDYFIRKKCKAIVFACNTATALAIEKMREKYSDMIFIGIEPAYKMVHDYAIDKNTLVMATPGTIYSDKFQKLYNQYDNKHTILCPCPHLASLIENSEDDRIISYLREFLPRDIKIDVVVLGCTHYPLIKKEISSVLGDVVFYDGGIGVAKRLYQLLKENNLICNGNVGSIDFYDSASSEEKSERFFELLKS